HLSRRMEKLLGNVESRHRATSLGQGKHQSSGAAADVEHAGVVEETEPVPQKRDAGARGFLGKRRLPELDGEAREELAPPLGLRLTFAHRPYGRRSPSSASGTRALETPTCGTGRGRPSS